MYCKQQSMYGNSTACHESCSSEQNINRHLTAPTSIRNIYGPGFSDGFKLIVGVFFCIFFFFFHTFKMSFQENRKYASKYRYSIICEYEIIPTLKYFNRSQFLFFYFFFWNKVDMIYFSASDR